MNSRTMSVAGSFYPADKQSIEPSEQSHFCGSVLKVEHF